MVFISFPLIRRFAPPSHRWGAEIVSAVIRNLGYKDAGVTSVGENYDFRGSMPSDNPSLYENVRGRPGKRNRQTGEVWVKDTLYRDHWEVYEDIRAYERGDRSYEV